MEALLQYLAIGWAYYQISNQNEGQSFLKIISILIAFGTMFVGGLIIFAIVMFFVFIFCRLW